MPAKAGIQVTRYGFPPEARGNDGLNRSPTSVELFPCACLDLLHIRRIAPLLVEAKNIR